MTTRFLFLVLCLNAATLAAFVFVPFPPVEHTEALYAAAEQDDDLSLSAVGVYLTAGSMSRTEIVSETLDATSREGGNALVFDVKGGAVYFDGDMPMAEELSLLRPQYDLPHVLSEARRRGIYTIARFVAVKDAGIVSALPDTLIAHPETGAKIGYEFVDPDHPDVLAYNREILCALAQSGIDEINLDYIRFSTEQPVALSVYSMEEKSRKVGEFVRMARQTINICGPKTKLGISTYAILGWNYEINLRNLGQDVIAFAPYVDIISPMAYPATFSENAYYRPGIDPGSRMYFLVLRTLHGYKELLGEEHAGKLRPWIQGYSVTRQNFIDQMQAVADAGMCGFTVWKADNAYSLVLGAMSQFRRPDTC